MPARPALPLLRVAAPLRRGSALAACSSSGTRRRQDAAAADRRTPHDRHVTITAAKGCQLDHTEFAAGGITFKITNKDATAVSEVELLSGERILGEKENVPAGLGGEFAVKVDAGTYTLYCPGARHREAARSPSPARRRRSTTASPALLKQGTDEYKKYVDTQIGYLVTATGKLEHRAARHGPHGGAGRLHRGPSVLREGRAGRRVVRQRQAEPRRRHRRARRTTSPRRSGAAST